MKKYLSTFAGSAICGGFAFGIWPELWKTYGLMPQQIHRIQMLHPMVIDNFKHYKIFQFAH